LTDDDARVKEGPEVPVQEDLGDGLSLGRQEVLDAAAGKGRVVAKQDGVDAAADILRKGGAGLCVCIHGGVMEGSSVLLDQLGANEDLGVEADGRALHTELRAEFGDGDAGPGLDQG
jgi:hypothetical protein